MKPLLLVVMACALFLSVGTVAARQGEDPCYYKGGTKSGDHCVINADVSIEVEYPIVLAQNPIVAATIDPFIKQWKDDFVAQVRLSDLTARGGVLHITYETYRHSDTIVSLVFRIYKGYGFQVHGVAVYQTYTFDLKANKLLTLSDLFLPDRNFFKVLVPVTNRAFIEQFAQFMYLGLAKFGNYPETYHAFALDQDTLVFFFDDYQLGSYALGGQLRIPLSQLSSVLKPEFAS